MKIAILGPKGTYTEKAALGHIEDNKCQGEIDAYKSITQVFKAVAQRNADIGVVPVYNKMEGYVNETLDCLWTHNAGSNKDIRITDMPALDILHCIGAMRDASKIKKIFSHPQALRQCSHYLDEYYPDAEREEAASTAQAIEDVVKQNLYDAAAIGSEAALMKYGLEVIGRNIVQNNKTLFTIISGKKTEPTGNDMTSIAIHPKKDEPGFLHGITGILYGGNINMSMIYSRTDREWGLILYIDIEGHEKESHIANAIDLIRHYLTKKPGELRILGSYKKAVIEKKGIKELREKIDETDSKMIGLIAERMGVIGEVAEYKRKSGMPVKDCKRETDLIAKIRKEAELLGLNADFAEKIISAIIEESVRCEEDKYAKNK